MKKKTDRPKCVERIHEGFQSWGCSRGVWKERPSDGYCKQHHPETVAARKAEGARKWNLNREKWREAQAIRDAQFAVINAAKTWTHAPGSCGVAGLPLEQAVRDLEQKEKSND